MVLMVSVRLTVAIAFLAVAGGIAFLLYATRPKALPTANSAIQRITVFKPEKVMIQRQWLGFGSAQAVNAADVSTRFPATFTGIINKVPKSVDEGLLVQKDQLLVQLDRTDFDREVESAKQQIANLQARLSELQVEEGRLADRVKIEQKSLKLLQDELERVQNLFDRGVQTQEGLDRAKRAVLDAERALLLTQEALDRVEPRRAQLEQQKQQAQKALEQRIEDANRTNILSPITGIIESVNVKEGESVQPGSRVARVVDLREMEVELFIPASARGSVAIGDQAEVFVEGDASQQWQATVSRMAATNDERNRTFAVYVVVKQPDAHEQLGKRGSVLLTPNAFVSARIIESEAREEWVVPRRSIRDGRIYLVSANDKKNIPTTAWREVPGTVESVKIERGFPYEGRFEAMSLPDNEWSVLTTDLGDIAAHQRIVANAGRSLLEGEQVIATNSALAEQETESAFNGNTSGAQP